MRRSIVTGPSGAKQALVPEHVLRLLAGMRCTGNLAHQIQEQLSREDYLALNVVLEDLGGAWNRKMKGHVFPQGVDAAARIGDVIACGSVAVAVAVDDRRANGCFFTQPDIAHLVVEMADVEPEHLVLEPNIGHGALVRALRNAGHRNTVHACELLQDNRDVVKRDFPEVTFLANDFLSYPSEDAFWYERILMNPPFAGQADIAHVTRALDLLSPSGGVLVAIMAAGVMFRENAKVTAFKKLLQASDLTPTWHPLPDDAFAASGTKVRTVLLRVQRGGAPKERRPPPSPKALPSVAPAKRPVDPLDDDTLFTWVH